jgi:hypothetical protein
MDTFDYGLFDKRARPPSILIKHLNNDRIVGSASQKLVLFKLFPIIFSDLVHSLPSFRVYKILREILELVLAYPFCKSWLPHLRDLCVEFQHAMLACFAARISPKIHFAAEYSQIIEDYGPSSRFWCMRFENRHAYFKQIAVRANNYKNVARTLSTRHQLKQQLLFSKPIFVNNVDVISGLKMVKEFHLDNRVKAILNAHFGPMNFAKDLFECSTLWHDQIEYHQSSVYVAELQGIEERPIFAQVVRIVRAQCKWLLLVDRLITKSYHDDLCAWEIESIEDFSLVDPHEMKYFHKGLDVYEINRSSFVSLMKRLTNWH